MARIAATVCADGREIATLDVLASEHPATASTAIKALVVITARA
jgi:hypothetical protein